MATVATSTQELTRNHWLWVWQPDHYATKPSYYTLYINYMLVVLTLLYITVIQYNIMIYYYPSFILSNL